MDERTPPEAAARMGDLGSGTAAEAAARRFGCDLNPQAAAFAERRPAAGAALLGGLAA